MLKSLTFDRVFKVVLVFLFSYFLYILTDISRSMRQNLDVGRFQIQQYGFPVFDSKTGKYLEK